jgi:hypothetical protein
MVWTSAYVSLGYIIAGDVEAAAFFLRQLSGLLIAATAAAGLAIYLFNPTLFSSRAAK